MTQHTNPPPDDAPRVEESERRSKGHRWVVALGTAAVLLGGLASLAGLRQPSVDLASLALPEDSKCGTDAVSFPATATAPERTVFRLPQTWHHIRFCLVDLLTSAATQPAAAPVHDVMYHQVLLALASKPVRFYEQGNKPKLRLAEVIDGTERFDFSKFRRIAYTNRKGFAYNSMTQVDLGSWLLLASREALTAEAPARDRAEAYLKLGLAAYGPVLDEVSLGGLRSRAECDLRPGYHCSFFHAVTNRSRPEPRSGGTLNKFLHVIRDLFIGAETLREIERLDPSFDLQPEIDRFLQAAVEGVNQLSYSSGNREAGAPPNYLDYIPKTANGESIKESWLYYAVNPLKQKGYFMTKNEYKNCSYHIRDLNLTYRIINEYGHYADLSGLTEHNDHLGESILDFIVETYRMKLADGGLYVDSETRGGGNFVACKEGYKDPAPQAVLRYLSELKADAPRPTN